MGAILEARDLRRWYPLQRSLVDMATRADTRYVKAVDGVSFSVASGQSLGIVGESGCGKSTLGRLLLGLDQATTGEVAFRGYDISTLKPRETPKFRRSAQMIFQDPTMSLNPRMTVGAALAEVLKVHDICAPPDRASKVSELLDIVGLPPEIGARLPRTLSGGQCQRVGIARALALEPEIIIADEAVSALDVSIQAQILNLFIQLQRSRNLALVFISHDLEVVRHVCDRVLVMYLGKIVEAGPVAEVFDNPQHPYTRSLISSVPRIDGPGLESMEMLEGEPPSPLNRPEGCPFHPRCSNVMSRCTVGAFPDLHQFGETVFSCHLGDAPKS